MAYNSNLISQVHPKSMNLQMCSAFIKFHYLKMNREFEITSVEHILQVYYHSESLLQVQRLGCTEKEYVA